MIYKIILCEIGLYPKTERIDLQLSAKAFAPFVRHLESFSEIDTDHFITSINGVHVDFVKTKRPYTKIGFYSDSFSTPHKKIIDDKEVL